MSNKVMVEQRGRVLKEMTEKGWRHFGVRQKLGSRESHRKLQGWPQLRPLAIADT